MGDDPSGPPGRPTGALPAPASGFADQGQTALDNPVDDLAAAGALEAGGDGGGIGRQGRVVYGLKQGRGEVVGREFSGNGEPHAQLVEGAGGEPAFELAGQRQLRPAGAEISVGADGLDTSKMRRPSARSPMYAIDSTT